MSLRFSRKTIEEKLVLCQMALKNAQEDEEVRTLIASYNYDAVRVSEGLALYYQADMLTRAQQASYSVQYSTLSAFYALEKEYSVTFAKHFALAELAFKKDTGQYNMLGIKGSIKKSYAARIAQAKSFYHNALSHPEVVAALAVFGVTQLELENGNFLIAKLENAFVAKESAKTEAQVATKARNEAFKNLQDWMFDFLGVCRCAFRQKPELMEKVGILHRVAPLKKKEVSEEEKVVVVAPGVQKPQPAPED